MVQLSQAVFGTKSCFVNCVHSVQQMENQCGHSKASFCHRFYDLFCAEISQPKLGLDNKLKLHNATCFNNLRDLSCHMFALSISFKLKALTLKFCRLSLAKTIAENNSFASCHKSISSDYENIHDFLQ